MSAVVEARTGRILAWEDSIPLHYEYTGGAANEAFLRGLLGGRILASKCEACGEVGLPPRVYCLQCFRRTRIDVEIQHLGRISSISTARFGADGARVDDTSRSTYGFVTFEGVRGGLVHRILRTGRREPGVGDPVRPVFAAPEARKGSILDLEGFRTNARR